MRWRAQREAVVEVQGQMDYPILIYWGPERDREVEVVKAQDEPSDSRQDMTGLLRSLHMDWVRLGQRE
jgi:hypothetical protein